VGCKSGFFRRVETESPFQIYGFAVVVFDEPGPHVLPRNFFGSVQVGEEAQGEDIFPARTGGETGDNVTMIRKLRVLYAQAPQFRRQMFRQFPLTRRRRGSGIVAVAGCPDPGIIEKAGNREAAQFFVIYAFYGAVRTIRGQFRPLPKK
jgi:hypothetical protein